MNARRYIMAALLIVIISLPGLTHSAFAGSWTICVGQCAQPDTRFFPGWTAEEIAAYVEFLRALLRDGAVTASGTALYGTEAEANPFARWILKATGVGGLYGAGLAWAITVYRIAHRLQPPFRLLFLRAVASAHLAASSTWTPSGISGPDVHIAIARWEW